MKKYKFTDDYMFCYVLCSRPDITKELLEIILDIEIDKIEIINAQQILGFKDFSHSVRLDVYIKSPNKVFDVEMQTYNHHDLAKRMRYYQSLITYENFERGSRYNDLHDSYVIFITNFDPFGLGEVLYHFSNKCKEHPELDYDDGAHSIVLNTSCKQPKTTKRLENLIKYLYKGNILSSFENQIQEIVENVNNNSNWRAWAMTLEEKMMYMREELKEEGRKIGLKEGIKIGKEQVIKKLVEEGIISKEEAKEYMKD